MPHPLIGFGLSRAVSLEHHLRSNHYPPVDTRWVPLCEQAIDLAVSIVYNQDMPEFGFDDSGLDEQIGQGKTARQILDGLHLWDYVYAAQDEQDEAMAGDYEPKRGE